MPCFLMTQCRLGRSGESPESPTPTPCLTYAVPAPVAQLPQRCPQQVSNPELEDTVGPWFLSRQVGVRIGVHVAERRARTALRRLLSLVRPLLACVRLREGSLDFSGEREVAVQESCGDRCIRLPAPPGLDSISTAWVQCSTKNT